MNTAIYLIKAAFLIIAGVITANIMLESGSMRKLSPLIQPFCRASNLPKEGAVSLLTSFFNPTAGKSTLAGFYHEGKISDKETILISMMSTFPIVVGESLFRVDVPIALTLLGPVTGGIYLALMFLSAFLQSFAAFMYAKVNFSPLTYSEEELYMDVSGPRTLYTQKLKTALKKSFTTLKRILPIMVVAFLVIDFLFTHGIMNYITTLFDPILRVLDLPGEVITVFIADLAHFSAGYAVVAALLAKGVITSKQAIITLLVGSILVITLIYLKYSLSMNISLFGTWLGAKITSITYLCSITVKALIILLVIVVM